MNTAKPPQKIQHQIYTSFFVAILKGTDVWYVTGGGSERGRLSNWSEGGGAVYDSLPHHHREMGFPDCQDKTRVADGEEITTN